MAENQADYGWSMRLAYERRESDRAERARRRERQEAEQREWAEREDMLNRMTADGRAAFLRRENQRERTQCNSLCVVAVFLTATTQEDVQLQPTLQSGAYFLVEPRYKLRSEGEKARRCASAARRRLAPA